MLEVVAALIWKEDQFLICQRPENKSRPLLWEFPGGKVEPGETKEAAILRECREELGCDLTVGSMFYEVTHAYPERSIHLTLFHCFLCGKLPRALEHHDLRWVQEAQLKDYPFCPADREIIDAQKGRFIPPNL